MRTIPILALALLVAGCEWVNPMMQQPKVKPYRESVFFPDQIAMRHPPAGTRPAGAPVEPAVVSGRNPDGTPLVPLTLDPPLFVAALLLATVTGLAAAFVPSLRAARLDPAVAIRG